MKINLGELNPEQLFAVENTEGPMLVLAGAGSGKTKVLTYRIAYLLEQGVPPWEILAITFTNKAAGEMKERVSDLVGAQARDVWLSTFHSFCVRFLRREIENMNRKYDRRFVIYDSSETLALIRQCLKEMNLDDKMFSPYGVQNQISNAKNQMMGPSKVAELAGNFYEEKIAGVFELYQKKLESNNALDFDDLLRFTVELLELNEGVRSRWQKQFQYILVDEYQDTNHVQYRMTRILAATHNNFFVVGDIDQSIYGWRGADIQNILDFEKDYPKAQVIKLEENYRSTQIILEAANAVISNNRKRRDKKLWTRQEGGASIPFFLGSDEREEGQFVCDRIQGYLDEKKATLGEMAVLYRTNAQSRVIEEAFLKNGIPYALVGAIRFYERKEIKDLLAYLRVVFNPLDSFSFQRVINVPRRGIGNISMQRIQDAADQSGYSLLEIATVPEQIEGISPKIRKALEELAAKFIVWNGLIPEMAVADLIVKVLEESGYLEELELEGTVEAEARIENLREFISVAREFSVSEEEQTLENFLSHVALVSDVDQTELSTEKVTLMTLHAAKGLEFPIVFLAGMEEGIFPHSRTLMSEEEIEEERRLAYVGITRAKKELFLTASRQRMIFGSIVSYPPSRFLGEIPAKLLESIQPIKKAVSESYGNSRYPSRSRTPIAPSGSTDWLVGDRVSHKKWGEGTVVSTKGAGEDLEISVAFSGQGIKKLMAAYAPLSKC
jgi:ATP-dependent DNA helicase PcrA